MIAAIASSVIATSIGADLFVKQWYPKGGNYVFVCEAQGFTPTAYDWDFGDGQKLYDVTNRDVFHRYDNGGQYVVSCTASDGWGNDVIGWKAINAESSEV